LQSIHLKLISWIYRNTLVAFSLFLLIFLLFYLKIISPIKEYRHKLRYWESEQFFYMSLHWIRTFCYRRSYFGGNLADFTIIFLRKKQKIRTFSYYVRMPIFEIVSKKLTFCSKCWVFLHSKKYSFYVQIAYMRHNSI
jgi:hypothetical protein